MEYQRLRSLLQSIDELDEKDGVFKVAETTNLTIHIGEAGQGIAVSRIKKIQLHDQWLEIESSDAGRVYVTEAQVSVVVAKNQSAKTASRTGFAV